MANHLYKKLVGKVKKHLLLGLVGPFGKIFQQEDGVGFGHSIYHLYSERRVPCPR